MPVERIIGIDFGTSTSVVKVKTYKDNEPLGLRDAVEYVHFDNKDSLPTLVYKTEDGRFLIGCEAESAAVKGTLYQNFKMNLISQDDSLRNEAVMYTEIFFKYMYEAYEKQKSLFPACDIETTYVSYPAKWSDELRKLMAGIAEKVGFKNVRGLDEPTAAIHTVMVLEGEKLVLGGQDSADILMIDMGAGTTDLVLCRYSPYDEQHIKVLNTWPNAGDRCLFGGREVDEALCEYIKAYLIDCGLPNTKNFNEKYLDKCKKWKEANLSPILKEKDGVVKYCGFVDNLLAMLDIEKDFPQISRNEFEDMMSGYISQFQGLITGCMEDIGYDAGQLDYVILTGGHSQWYFAGEILEGKLTRFGTPKLPKILPDSNRIIKLARPQETVALGLVYQRIVIKHQDRPSIKVTGIINLISERYITKTGADLFADSAALKRLEEAAKRAVVQLSESEKAEIDIPYISANSNGPLHLKETITRSELAEFITRYEEHQPRQEKVCIRCGRKIPAGNTFCVYCGYKIVEMESTVKAPEPPAQKEIFCSRCGSRIPVYSGFCRYCGNEIKPHTGDVKSTETASPSYPITITRESQFICVAVQYRVFVNGIDCGSISAGETINALSSTQVAVVEIVCTTVMMTNIRASMRLRLGYGSMVRFKLEYGGRIIPMVMGAEILESYA